MTTSLPQQHYFSPDPGADAARRTVPVSLAGRDVEVVTAAGVFSIDGLDLGTRVLLREVPDPPETGDLLDLGCGWGPIALTLAMLAPRATVWAVDVNPRALELTGENARRLHLSNVKVVAPQEVPYDVRFAAIWSNPPIRVGKEALHALLLHWLPRLGPDAAAHLVVQRHLGADSLHAWLGPALAAAAPGRAWQTRRAGSAKGFRVLEVTG